MGPMACLQAGVCLQRCKLFTVRGSLNCYHHHGIRFPWLRSVGKDSQGATTGSSYTVVPLSPCLWSPPAPPLCSIEQLVNPWWTTTIFASSTCTPHFCISLL